MSSATESILIPTSLPVLIRKQPQMSLYLKIIRWTFPRMEVLFPRYAHRWFINRFFTPIKYPLPVAEKEILSTAERFIIPVGNNKVQAYTWGKGPVILLVHGWAGRASQFKNVITHFVAEGYQVVAFDAPAHGMSQGIKTNIFEFKDAILSVAKHVGKVEGVIAHSIGGAAVMFALTQGLAAKRVITIATPTVGDEILNEFTKRLNGSQKAVQKLKDFIHHSFNCSFDELTAAHFASTLTVPINLLIVHDENDKEASFQNAFHLKEAYPAAQLLTTQGLGHVRILRNEDVIRTCLQFIRGSV